MYVAVAAAVAVAVAAAAAEVVVVAVVVIAWMPLFFVCLVSGNSGGSCSFCTGLRFSHGTGRRGRVSVSCN